MKKEIIIFILCLVYSGCSISVTRETHEFDSKGNRIISESSSFDRPYVIVKGTMGMYEEIGKAAKQVEIEGKAVTVSTDDGTIYAEPTGQIYERYTVTDSLTGKETIMYNCRIIKIRYERKYGIEETKAIVCP